MTRQIKGIVFDMDGLMVDSEPVQLRAINDALAPLGIVVQEAGFIDMVGRKAIENFRTLKQQYQFAESPEEVEERKNRAYLRRIKTELFAMPGLDQALELCDDEHLIPAIASSSPRPDILAVLKILNRESYFQVIVGGDQVKRGKPAPDVFIKAAEMLGCVPSSLVVLEDTAHGVNAARAAGMFCIAIPNRYTQNQDFSRAHKRLPSLEALTISVIDALV